MQGWFLAYVLPPLKLLLVNPTVDFAMAVVGFGIVITGLIINMSTTAIAVATVLLIFAACQEHYDDEGFINAPLGRSE